MLSYRISDNTCRRLLQYVRELRDTASKEQMYYGNAPRPRRKEGSGCSAYGVSFLELAGIMEDHYKSAWVRATRVPLKLMGGYGVKKISVFRILSMPESKRWATPDEPHMYQETYEPTDMYHWVRKLTENLSQLQALGGKLDTSIAAELPGIPAIVFDRRDVLTPTEPIFRGERSLEHVTDYAVRRADKTYRPDGGFDLIP